MPVLQLRRLDYVVLIVEELDRAVRFYTDVLGLPLKHRAEAFAQLDTGDTRLALYTREAMARTTGRPLAPADPGHAGFELGFFVSDVDDAYGKLVEAGATPVTPPTDRAWGQRTAYVADPDGHLIELVAKLG